MNSVEAQTLSNIYFAELPHADQVNIALRAAYEREKRAEDLRHTHHFGGRFENTYIPAQRIAELDPVMDFARRQAVRILGRPDLRAGFWFNEMHTGHRTSLHSHEELDELLSAVYYVQCPPDSGNLLLHDDEALITVKPRPGLLVLFPPDLPHEVEENRAAQMRLSVAFNFGPTDSQT